MEMAANKAVEVATNSGTVKPESEDHSVLSKPINVGISGIQHVIHCLQRGTAEVRDLLLNECELLYECKVCRSLHRSLVNFLAHKRTYCKEHMCETMMLFHEDDIEKETILVQPEDPDGDKLPGTDCLSEVEHLSNNDQVEVGLSTPKILQPLHNSAKRLTMSAARMLQPALPICSSAVRTGIEYMKKQRIMQSVTVSEPSELALKLDRIPSNPNAMFQRRIGESLIKDDPEPEVNGEVTAFEETDENSGNSRGYDTDNSAVHQDKLKDRADCNLDTKTCLICKTQYISFKTLSFHMRNIHATVRTFYQCPYCETSFSQPWGVTRHLMQVHKTSRAKVSVIMSTVRRNAVKKVLDPTDNGTRYKPAAPVRKNKSKGLYACKNCGKTFQLKSAVAGHTSHCNRRTRSHLKKAKFMVTKSKPQKTPKITPPVQPTLISSRPKRVVKKKDTSDFVSGGRRVSTVSKKIEVQAAPPKTKPEPVFTEELDSIINIAKLKCLKCVRKFSSISNLRRHSAIHIGWNRFKCKYCDYQSYNRSDCMGHIKRVHGHVKACGDLDEMVINLLPPTMDKTLGKAGSSVSSSPDSKQGSRVKRSPGNPAKTRKTRPKSEGKIPPQAKKIFIVKKPPQIAVRPTPSISDSMLTTLVTRASSYMKPSIAAHLLNRERAKVAVKEAVKEPVNKKQVKNKNTVALKQRMPRKKKMKIKEVNGEICGGGSDLKDMVNMESDDEEDLVVEPSVAEDDLMDGCEEFIVDTNDIECETVVNI